MSDDSARAILNANIAKDEQRLRELQESEAKLRDKIPLKGFAAASSRARLESEMRILETTIYENRVRLAALE